MHAWLASSLTRYYPASPAEARDGLLLEAARGEKLSFQVVFRTDFSEATTTVAASVSAPPGLALQVRRVGYVPLPHFNTDTPLAELDGVGYIPGYVPDPLLPETEIIAGAGETHSFWITVRVAPEARPASYPISILLSAGEEKIVLSAMVVVYPARLAPRRNFPVMQVFHADAVCQWYGTELWQERFWQLLDPYLTNIVEHGQDSIYVPLFTPPLDGVKRPTQLLGISRDGERYHFDWSLARRWTAACRAKGVTSFEWSHFFTQWGAQQALRVYEGHGEGAQLLWPAETAALSPVYRNFLEQFMPEFKRFLEGEGLLDCSLFHLSDEPNLEHLESYRAARELLRELAPWMKVIDALSDLDFAKQGLTDVVVPITWSVMDFLKEGFDPWVYYCCYPKGVFLNRLLDTPLAKVRMSGWLFYRTQVRGFLHWGYNYWYQNQTTRLIDPFMTNDGLSWPLWSHGDPFVVYPGPTGPLDSLRWEVFAESLQDYAMLQTVGIDPADAALAEIKDYGNFPKSEEWLTRSRSWLLQLASVK